MICQQTKKEPIQNEDDGADEPTGVQEQEEGDENAEGSELLMKTANITLRGPKGIPNPWNFGRTKAKKASPGNWLTDQAGKMPLWRNRQVFGAGRFTHR